MNFNLHISFSDNTCSSKIPGLHEGGNLMEEENDDESRGVGCGGGGMGGADSDIPWVSVWVIHL